MLFIKNTSPLEELADVHAELAMWAGLGGKNKIKKVRCLLLPFWGVSQLHGMNTCFIQVMHHSFDALGSSGCSWVIRCWRKLEPGVELQTVSAARPISGFVIPEGKKNKKKPHKLYYEHPVTMHFFSLAPSILDSYASSKSKRQCSLSYSGSSTMALCCRLFFFVVFLVGGYNLLLRGAFTVERWKKSKPPCILAIG